MESAKRQQEVRERLQLIESLVQQYSTVSKLKIRKPSIAHVYQCDWLAKILGVELELIISGTESQSCWDVYARWDLKLPMRLGHVATCQLSSRNTWPKIPKLRLSPQNTIPPNSEIIKACESGDIARIQHLLSMKAVHPNDRTPDNLTVLRVSLLFDPRYSANELNLASSMGYAQVIQRSCSCFWTTALIRTLRSGNTRRTYRVVMKAKE